MLLGAVRQRQVDAAQHPRRARRPDRAAASAILRPRPDATPTSAALTRFRREHVGFVFQFYNLIPSLTARENVALVTEISPTSRWPPEEALDVVGLGDRLDHFPGAALGRRAAARRHRARHRQAAGRAAVRRADRRARLRDRQARARGAERVNRELGTTTAVITHNAAIAGMADRVVRMRSGANRRDAQERSAASAPRSSTGSRRMKPSTASCCATCWHLRGQVAAIVAGRRLRRGRRSSTTRTAYDSLVSARSRRTTARYRFADVFAQLKRAPEACAATDRRDSGVAAVETRVVVDVTLDVPGLDEPATGRLVSIPERSRPLLNDRVPARRPLDRSGPPRGSAGERGLRARRTVCRRRHRSVRSSTDAGSGCASSASRSLRSTSTRSVATDLFPDNRRFGVIWMSRTPLGPAFDMDGAFNDVVLALAPDATSWP